MTTPEQRGYSPENEGRPEPTLVQYREQEFEAAVAADDRAGVTPSANRAYWARAIDDGYTESDRASNAAQMAAFAEYQRRPDIESRASILAREHAAPAEFENVSVPNGNFDAAVANAVPTNKSGYIGHFDFEDGVNGRNAAASNGQGKVEEGDYTVAPYDAPGNNPYSTADDPVAPAPAQTATDSDGDGVEDANDAFPNDPNLQ